MKFVISFATALTLSAGIAAAQDGVIVYRLGRDTVAVEQFSRSRNRLAGEVVTRNGPAVFRTQYEFTLGANGRPTSAIARRRNADGSVIANAPTEYRFTFGADSARRDIVWKDSTQTRSFAGANIFPTIQVFAYAPFELINGYGAGRDSILSIGLAGNGTSIIGLQPFAGDTLRMRGGTYQMLVRLDKEGRLQWVDGSLTTNKATGTRSSAKVDIAAIAANMKPTGVLSPRATAYAGFAQGPIFINYGRPAVRDRTVWGGTLVPFDTVWRAGANEATHLATSKTIVLGDMTLAPGLYTLWIQHTRNGTFLIVNKQVGQWGTQYQAANDIGRVALDMTNTPEHVEDYTITIRPTGGPRGAIDFAWGNRMGTANFTVRP
jgi:hypothetical protein